MPSFSNASPGQWAQMRASTSMSSYDVMENLTRGSKARQGLSASQLGALPDLIEAGWVSEDGNGMLSLTEEGRTHLKSF